MTGANQRQEFLRTKGLTQNDKRSSTPKTKDPSKAKRSEAVGKPKKRAFENDRDTSERQKIEKRSEAVRKPKTRAFENVRRTQSSFKKKGTKLSKAMPWADQTEELLKTTGVSQNDERPSIPNLPLEKNLSEAKRSEAVGTPKTRAESSWEWQEYHRTTKGRALPKVYTWRHWENCSSPARHEKIWKCKVHFKTRIFRNLR